MMITPLYIIGILKYNFTNHNRLLKKQMANIVSNHETKSHLVASLIFMLGRVEEFALMDSKTRVLEIY